MLEIMISVNPPYSHMIMSGHKFMEFRKTVLTVFKNTESFFEEKEMPKLYIYETKNKKGIGKIIGECKVLRMYKPMYHFESKTGYTLLFIENQIAKRREDLIIDLYRGWCYDNQIKYNSNEGWFKSKKFSIYLEEIGWNSREFNYAMYLDNIQKYEHPKKLDEFINSKGVRLKRPPQNMFYVNLLENGLETFEEKTK